MESSAFVPSLPRVDIAALSLFLAFALGTLLLRSGRSLVVLLVGELRARQARRSSAVPRQEALHSSALLHTGCQCVASVAGRLRLPAPRTHAQPCLLLISLPGCCCP